MTEPENNPLIDYLLGDLSEKDRHDMELQIEGSVALQQELESLKVVLGLWDQQAEVKPSDYSRDQFYRFLELEARQQPDPASRPASRLSWWAAAAVALISIGIGFGVIWQNNTFQQEQIRRLSAEVVETRKLMLLAMLEDPSASDRIKAMNISTRDFQQDRRVVDALINRLRNDENENVRLKAAEALTGFMNLDGVAEAAIQALELESSPEVQIMLIELLANGKRKEAEPSFLRLLKREDVPAVVRDLAAYGLEMMI